MKHERPTGVRRRALDSVPKFQQLGRCLGRHLKSNRGTGREGQDLGVLRAVSVLGSFLLDSRYGEHQSRHETVVC